MIEKCDWITEVDNDAEIKNKENCDPDNFIRKEGTLLKITKRGNVLVVPKSERKKILEQLHDAKTSGHLGRRKVLEKCQERFYWPGMTKDIVSYMRNCHICAVSKDTSVPVAPLQPVDVSTFHPFQRIAMDIMGPIQPITKHGNKYIIICQDYFTKWVELKALPSTEASIIIQFLTDEVFNRYGICNELVTDQGTQFTSKKFKEFLSVLGVQHKMTSVYHPQSDMVERTNRTFLNMIRPYVSQEADDWDDNLQNLAFAYRTSYHKGIGVSPFEAVHGWKATLPVDIYCANLIEDEKIIQSELFRKMVEVRRKIRTTASIQAKKRSENYDRSRSAKPPRKINEGDQIYWKRPIVKKGISPKLQKKWSGPFKILKKLSDVNFRIADEDGSNVTVHINNMKRCYGKQSMETKIRKRGRPRKQN